jgi:hypothetical protein
MSSPARRARGHPVRRRYPKTFPPAAKQIRTHATRPLPRLYSWPLGQEDRPIADQAAGRNVFFAKDRSPEPHGTLPSPQPASLGCRKADRRRRPLGCPVARQSRRRRRSRLRYRPSGSRTPRLSRLLPVAQSQMTGPICALFGFKSKPITVVWGTSSTISSTRFCHSSWLRLVTPVRFSPGRAKLATSPLSSGSAPVEKTVGMVEVALFATNDPPASSARRLPSPER